MILPVEITLVFGPQECHQLHYLKQKEMLDWHPVANKQDNPSKSSNIIQKICHKNQSQNIEKNNKDVLQREPKQVKKTKDHFETF